MVKRTVLTCLVLVLAAVPALAQTWQDQNPAGFAWFRIDAAYNPGDGLMYIMGGRVDNDTTEGSVWSYDPATGSSVDTGVDLPVPISNYFISAVDDPQGFGFYVIGGRGSDGTMLQTVQVYYPGTNTAQEVTTDPFPGTPRLVGGQVVVDNKIYVFGGFESTVMNSDTYVFDPMAAAGARWTNLGVDMSVERAYIHCAAVDGKIYAIGGDEYVGGDEPLSALTLVEVLDTANTAAGWVAGPALPERTGESPAFGFDSDSPYALAGKIVVAGGGIWPDDSNKCFVLDVASGVWNNFPNLVHTRRNHGGEFYPVGDGQLWVFGGINIPDEGDSVIMNIPEMYDLAGSAPADIEITLTMPAASFATGDTCGLDLSIVNSGDAIDVDLYILLAVGSGFWFYPSWVQSGSGIDFESLSITAGHDEVMEIIPDFTMPTVGPAGPFYFYGAMFQQGTLSLDTLASNGAVVSFSLE